MPATGIFHDYSDDETVFEAYIAGAGSRPGPTVLLAHDWSGLNAGMRRNAQRIAELGYTCFALDVYGKGRRGDELGDNHFLMNPMLEDRAELRRRLLAGLTAATEHPAVDRSRIAAPGYCFGGLCVLDLTRANPANLKGVISVHGVLKPPNIGQQGPIASSVMVLHGWEDPLTPREDVHALADEMTRAGADWQLHAYGHARHAFTAEGIHMPERGIAYNAAAAGRSWKSIGEFLIETIGQSDRNHETLTE
jgi:dienelactone hydrolase